MTRCNNTYFSTTAFGLGAIIALTLAGGCEAKLVYGCLSKVIIHSLVAQAINLLMESALDVPQEKRWRNDFIMDVLISHGG